MFDLGLGFARNWKGVQAPEMRDLFFSPIKTSEKVYFTRGWKVKRNFVEYTSIAIDFFFHIASYTMKNGFNFYWKADFLPNL